MDINVITTGSCGRGMTYWDREITKEQFDRAQDNGGRITAEDTKLILDEAERLGYGASATGTFEQGGKFYVHCSRANSCD
jgi:hypothetical protein